ncbi:MAG: hypothetical protein ACLTYN_06790 [Dysosmobacter welbionis]
MKELLVIAQDITRYGTDLNGEHQLASPAGAVQAGLPLGPAPLSVSDDH